MINVKMKLKIFFIVFAFISLFALKFFVTGNTVISSASKLI